MKQSKDHEVYQKAYLIESVIKKRTINNFNLVKQLLIDLA
jgi:hypothetical protein